MQMLFGDHRFGQRFGRDAAARVAGIDEGDLDRLLGAGGVGEWHQADHQNCDDKRLHDPSVLM
jgi:hypothetical protein